MFTQPSHAFSRTERAQFHGGPLPLSPSRVLVHQRTRTETFFRHDPLQLEADCQLMQSLTSALINQRYRYTYDQNRYFCVAVL